MVDSVSNSNFRPPPPPPPSSQSASLNDEQTLLIEETLANFDANNLSADDANSIVETFSQAGIAPSADFASVLEASGFDAREIGDLANTGESRPPPPTTAQTDGADLASITDYLDSLISDSSENSSNVSLAEQVAQRFGLAEDQPLISISV